MGACPVFSRVGVACLQPLYDVQRAVSLENDPALLQCLVFLREAVRLVQPTVFPLYPRVGEKIVLVWTDASGIPRLGVVLYHPDTGKWYYASGMVPPWMVAWFKRLSRKKTYI